MLYYKQGKGTPRRENDMTTTTNVSLTDKQVKKMLDLYARAEKRMDEATERKSYQSMDKARAELLAYERVFHILGIEY